MSGVEFALLGHIACEASGQYAGFNRTAGNPAMHGRKMMSRGISNQMGRAAAAALLFAALSAQAASGPPKIRIDGDDIGGVVTGASGPEAGVWVIAETKDLKTKFARIVVTDELGRF